MEVEQIAEGLWRWVVDDGAGGVVASTYLEAPDAIVLVDPVLPPPGEELERFWRALDRDASRSDAPLHVIATGRRAAGGSAIRLRYPGTRLWPAGAFSPADDLPGGVSAWPVNAEGGTQSLLWIPAHAALVAGSVLVGADGGLRVETPALPRPRGAPAPRLAPGRARPRDARRARPVGRRRGPRPCNRRGFE